MRILAASPVHQQPETLSLFLKSLERLELDNYTVDYLFVNLDADEIFADHFADAVRTLIATTNKDVICFRLYDMWSETEFRSDSYWQSHNIIDLFNYVTALISPTTGKIKPYTMADSRECT